MHVCTKKNRYIEMHMQEETKCLRRREIAKDSLTS